MGYSKEQKYRSARIVTTGATDVDIIALHKGTNTIFVPKVVKIHNLDDIIVVIDGAEFEIPADFGYEETNVKSFIVKGGQTARYIYEIIV
jgi:hypothetical protein